MSRPSTVLTGHNSLCLTGEWLAAQVEKTGSGTFAAVPLGEYFLATTDPGNIKVILATEFNNFEKGKSAAPNGVFVDPPSLLGSYSREAMASVIGEGVFNVDGKFNSPVLVIALI